MDMEKIYLTMKRTGAGNIDSWNLIHLCWSYIRNHADRNWCKFIKEKEAH